MRHLALGFAALCLFSADAAYADDIIPSHCVALSQADPNVHFVALGDQTPTPAALTGGQVRLHFVGHATFVIETAAGLRVATDYTGYAGGLEVPDIVTMNRAHSSHYTSNPDPRITHVLRGWGAGPDEPADHYVEEGDLIVRNVPTDIRSYSARQPNANSIFVFETAGLCIAHLGHLHHEPSDLQYALLGRMDIVMAPVDGGFTMSQPAMIRVLNRVKARLVLPMHWFGPSNLESFLNGMSDAFEVRRMDRPDVVMSLDELPREPLVMVLMPGAWSDESD
ncbi:MAG: MBL fold metallo-hydrolase [Pseudomonadota bacterium]